MLRGYRDAVPGSFNALLFFADIEEWMNHDRIIGMPEWVTVNGVCSRMKVAVHDVVQLFVFLDHIKLGRFDRRQQKLVFLADPEWIGYCSLTDKEKEDIDDFYGRSESASWRGSDDAEAP